LAFFAGGGEIANFAVRASKEMGAIAWGGNRKGVSALLIKASTWEKGGKANQISWNPGKNAFWRVRRNQKGLRGLFGVIEKEEEDSVSPCDLGKKKGSFRRF